MSRTSLVKATILLLLALKIASLWLGAASGNLPDWFPRVYDSSLYLLIGGFVLAEGGELRDYNIESLALILFLAFSTFLRVEIRGGNTLIATLLRLGDWLVAGVILLKLLRKEIAFSPPSGKDFGWIGAGLLASVALSVPAAYLMLRFPSEFQLTTSALSFFSSLGRVLGVFLYELSSAAVPEEFIFRGLLWGYLVRRNGKVGQAWVIQGLAFWLFHLEQMKAAPFVFWIIIPLCTALYSVLAWRSKGLTASILAHGVLDTFPLVFATLLAST
jgi:membrane protease YdiL (CAAX protease family)